MSSYDPFAHVRDKIASESEFSLAQWIAAGDTSTQGPNGNQIVCSAVAALPEKRLVPLSDAIDQVIREYTDAFFTNAIELHAKDIWNGDSRRKSAFATLSSKNEMQEFFIHIARIISPFSPVISVSIGHVNSVEQSALEEEFPRVPLIACIKRKTMFHATARLNDNIKKFSKKHMGKMPLVLDREHDRLFERHGPDGSIGTGFLALAEILENSREDDDVQYIRSLDPRYSEADSKSNRLIQIADIASYFAGKYFRNLDDRLSAKNNASDRKSLDAKLADQEFARLIWDILNLEISLFIHESQAGRWPLWMRAVCHGYEKVFQTYDIRDRRGPVTELEVVLRERLAVPPYNFDHTRFAR